ncbi:hypothetical protein [Herbaspirillum sp. C9C3]|uniref:hypothetical protein n=1 Tax=Herbaspirillum sp. C9C3 TaxID=2735271 RepID=UPI0015849C04|nr:hypothetical protein [Herbaspirillum sp. C9C3]NUT61914.1 hypothetical protein [Herbaspirillum sp. C9C3]
MWTSTAEADLKSAFDDAIKNAYGSGLNGELENLAELFSPAALYAYKTSLLKGLDNQSDAAVDLAWIDKRPVAYRAKVNASPIADEVIKPGCELGDMLLIANTYGPDGTLQKSQACILEVKQANAVPIPAVPVFPNEDSTRNQFKILESWPKLYGIKKTGSNNDYLVKAVNTWPNSPKNGGVRAQAWYVAVLSHGTPLGTLKSPWMAAPAVSGEPFDKYTLGEIFSACAQGISLKTSIGDIQVGREFERKNYASASNWNAVINSIIHTTQAYDLPKSLFPSDELSRYFWGYRARGSWMWGAIGLALPSTEFTTGVVTGLAISAAAFMALRLYKWVQDRQDHERRLEDWEAQKADRFWILSFNVKLSRPLDEVSRPD